MFTSNEPDLQSLERLLESARMGWWKAELGTGEMLLSEYAAACLGLKSPRTTRARIFPFIRADYRDRIHERIDALATENHFDETFPVRIGAEEQWFHAQVVGRLTDTRRGIRLFGYVQQVSARDSDEAERLSLESSYHTLLRKSRHMDQLLDSLPIGYLRLRLLYDAEGEATDYVCLMINQAAQQITGYIAADMVGKNAHETGHYDAEHIRQLVNVRVGEHIEGEWFIAATDRHCRCFLYNTPNDQTEIVVLLLDLTDLIRTERELIAAKERAEEANKLKSAFLANVSHEIRTPLNAIVGFSELLAEEEDAATRAEYAAIISTNNNQLLQIISDVLDLARIESGRTEVVRSHFDIGELCREITGSMRLQCAPGVELRCAEPEAELMIRSWRQGLFQVLSNYTRNALKFTREGSVVVGFGALSGEGVRIYVRDTGIGIAPEERTRIFERFYKIDTFTQGTGLGLSICKTIAEQLGGRVGVDSEPGRGSTFYIDIPAE